jgi:hypothetical protein
MDRFDITIKTVKKLPEGDCGYCIRRNRKGSKYEIEISEAAHKNVAEFGSTLLHELLHLWVYVLQIYGYRVKLKYEHKWIQAVEKVVIEFMYILKQGEKDEIKKRRSH